MAENMKNSVIDIAKLSISSLNDTDSIAEHIVKSLKEKYGFKWFCSVSSGGNFKELIWNGIDYSILSFRIESLMINILKLETPVCEKRVFLPKIS
jgi:hypothetical protein